MSEEEFSQILPNIDDYYTKLLIQSAFHTGCRVGELFALDKYSLKINKTLIVDSQIKKTGITTDTKNRLERKVFVSDEGLPILKEWIDVPKDKKLEIRNKKWSKIVKDLCIKTFPNDTSKHNMTFHDLRHSYCIYLLAYGVSMSLISQGIGSSISVVNKYYAGFSLTDDNVEAIRQMMAKHKAI